MSGIYEELQAYVKNQNPLAVYIPCTTQLLNLVGVHSVRNVNFFKWMAKCNIIIFPNIHVAIRIYLTVPVANCTTEQ